MTAIKLVRGIVKDIQPKQSKPWLELSFPQELASSNRWEHGQKISIKLDDGPPWSVEVGLRQSKASYIRTSATRAGLTERIPDLLLGMHLAHGAELNFAVESRDLLRLVAVSDSGKSPDGRFRGGRPKTDKSGGHPSAVPKLAKTKRKLAPTPKFPLDDPAIVAEFSAGYEAWMALHMPAHWKLEQSFPQRLASRKNELSLGTALFCDICDWKFLWRIGDSSTPPPRPYAENSDSSIRRAVGGAFQATEDAEAIDALRSLKGVKLRMASALLHWMRPAEFPILDVRMARSLADKAADYSATQWEHPRTYMRLANRVRSASRDLGVDLRTLDRALWFWDRKHRGR